MKTLPQTVNKILNLAYLILLTFSIGSHAESGLSAFNPGTVIKDFGRIAAVNNQLPIPEDMKFKVAFDLGLAADEGKINRQIDTLARFINMHVANGVKLEDIELAMVVHGKAAMDMTGNLYQKRNKGTLNANQALIAELTKHQVRFYVCGQTAAYYAIDVEDLLPGVNMALSALTAHAILAQQGYSLNPF